MVKCELFGKNNGRLKYKIAMNILKWVKIELIFYEAYGQLNFEAWYNFLRTVLFKNLDNNVFLVGAGLSVDLDVIAKPNDGGSVFSYSQPEINL